MLGASWCGASGKARYARSREMHVRDRMMPSIGCAEEGRMNGSFDSLRSVMVDVTDSVFRSPRDS